VSLGHPCKFQWLSRLGSITAQHYSSVRQPNFAALNRGRHLYLAGRPSRWALAHILVVSIVQYSAAENTTSRYDTDVSLVCEPVSIMLQHAYLLVLQINFIIFFMYTTHYFVPKNWIHLLHNHTLRKEQVQLKGHLVTEGEYWFCCVIKKTCVLLPIMIQCFSLKFANCRLKNLHTNKKYNP